MATLDLAALIAGQQSKLGGDQVPSISQSNIPTAQPTRTASSLDDVSGTPAGSVGGIDLAGLLHSVNQNQAMSDDDKIKTHQAYAKAIQFGEQRASDTLVEGDAQSIIATQAENAKLQVQNNDLKAATIFGTNLGSTSEVISALAAKSQAAYDQSQAIAQKVHDKQSISFLDDPLGWIESKFTIGQDYSDYEQAAFVHNSTEQRIAELNQNTQSSVVTQNALEQAHSAATVQAQSSLVTLQAKVQAAKIGQENAALNINEINALGSMTDKQLGNMFQVYQATNSEKGLALQEQHLILAKKQADLSLQEATVRLKEHKLKDEELSSMQEIFDRGATTLGLSKIPAAKAMQLINAKGEGGELARSMWNSGSVGTLTSAPYIAASAGEAATILATTKAQLPATMNQLTPLLTKEYAAQLRVAQAKGEDPIKGKDDIAAKVTQAVVGKLQTYSADIDSADLTNPYGASPISTLLKVGGVASLPLYTKVLAPNQVENSDPKYIVAQAAQAVKDGKISFEECASGIQKLYSAAAAQNNATKGFKSIGVPTQSSYTTTLPSVADIDMSYNLMDYKDASLALTRQLHRGFGNTLLSN